MTIPENILNKVKKLLALAASSNIHEANLALSKAKEIMDKYQIEQEELEDSLEEVSIFDDCLDTFGRVSSWKENVAVLLGQYNRCKIFFKVSSIGDGGIRKKTNKTLCIVGYQSDALMVSYLYKYCISQIDFLTKKHTTGKGKVYANNFRLGCVEAIWDALQKEKEEIEKWAKEAGKTTALIKIDKRIDIVNEFYNSIGVIETRQKSQYCHDDNARIKGRELGKQIHVTKGQFKKRLTKPNEQLKDN